MLLLQAIVTNAESFNYVSLTAPEEAQYCATTFQYTFEFPFPVTRGTDSASMNSKIYVSEGSYTLAYEGNNVLMTVTRSSQPTSGVFQLLINPGSFFHEQDGNVKITSSFYCMSRPSPSRS